MTKIKPVRKCYYCDFFHQTHVRTGGECHYDPPVNRKWPIVLNGDWCGKFEKGNVNHDPTTKNK